MFASYTRDWLSVRGSISDDLGGHHEGVLASFAVEAKYHATQRLTLSIGPEVTWVNTQYANTFFGINASQSAIAGIAPSLNESPCAAIFFQVYSKPRKVANSSTGARSERRELTAAVSSA